VMLVIAGIAAVGYSFAKAGPSTSKTSTS